MARLNRPHPCRSRRSLASCSDRLPFPAESDYWSISGLDAFYLEDSWVLRIVARPGTLDLVVDLVLRESHPSYEPPSAG